MCAATAATGKSVRGQPIDDSNEKNESSVVLENRDS